MVATLVRLRLATLRHTLRREGWRVVVLVAGVVWALTALPSVATAMLWLSRQSTDVAHDVLVVGGGLLLLGWTVVPVLVPGLDDSLDITRFRTFGVPARRLVPGLLTASLLSVPTLFTAAVCLAPVLAWVLTGERPAVVTALLAAPLALLSCVLASRLSTTVAARLLASRRSRELSVVLGLLAGVVLVPLTVGVAAVGLEGALEAVPAVAAVLGWTPLGAVWSAPAAAAGGHLVEAAAKLVVAGLACALGVVAWSVLLGRALVHPPTRGGQARRRADAVLPRRARRHPGTTAALAVLRRASRYWTADPRYMSALLAAVAFPLLIVLLAATVVDAPAAVALVMAPLMAGTIGWGRHNDVAFDGSAFWLHVAARTPGWADRLGRAAGTLVWAAPLAVVVGVLGAVVAERTDLAVASVGAALGVLCAGLAVSAVSSAVLVYPVPEPGANPYSAQMGAVGASLLAQLVTSAATLLLSAPVLVAFAAALWWDPVMAWPTLGLGGLGGALTLAVGVVLGGRVYDRRASRLLVRLA